MNSHCVLLIDDHAIMLDGLRMLLETRIDNATIISTLSVHEAMGYAIQPNIIVLDIKLPGINGLEGLAQLKYKWPLAQIVMLSSQDDTDTRQDALARGAAVFISKTETGERITHIVHQLLQGQVAETMPGAVQQYLTPRQCEVLELLSQGLTNKLIARQLNLSDNTVRRHVQDIFSFFNVARRTEAVFEARRQGLVR